jgi:hypothetical protein
MDHSQMTEELSTLSHVKYKNSNIREGGGFQFCPSMVQLADHFPIKPGFSVTIHKAQVIIIIWILFVIITKFHF